MKVEMYRGRKMLRQAWRWRARADNNRIIATGGEAYTNAEDCRTAIRLLFGDVEIQTLK